MMKMNSGIRAGAACGFLGALLLAATSAHGEAGISVPWEEFSRIYRENIERAVREKIREAARVKAPQVFTLDAAEYAVTVRSGHAQGSLRVTGRVLSGEPAPIVLFDGTLVVASVENVAGGALWYDDAEPRRLCILPAGTNAFEVALTFFAPILADSTSKYVSWTIPEALRNTLRVALAGDVSLTEGPGIADESGAYHFAPATTLTVRFRDKTAIADAARVEADTLTEIRLQDQRLLLTTYVAPSRHLPPGSVLEVPAGQRFLSSGLRRSWCEPLEDGTVRLNIPADAAGPFKIQFVRVAPMADGDTSIALPRLRGNQGSEGNFVLVEPDDGRMTVRAGIVAASLPVSRLAAPLREQIAEHRLYMQIPAGEELALSLRRFQAAATPPLVLETVAYYTAFEENGNALSILVLDAPPEAGSRLKLNAVAGAQIWSLTVNGETRRVYTDESSVWVVPLEGSAPSHVELAFLSKGNKLGLQGRLETLVPQTGLSARHLLVGLALPARVQVLSVEGPVNPEPRPAGKPPADFLGRPHYFGRAFYKGEALQLAVSYKEPVNTDLTSTRAEQPAQ